MKNATRVAAFSIVFIMFAAKWALAVSLPECITNSQDANNIIQSASCGLYGVVNSRQTSNGTGITLDITVEYMVHLPSGAPKAIVMLFTGSSGNAGIVGDDTTHVVSQSGATFLFAAHSFSQKKAI